MAAVPLPKPDDTPPKRAKIAALPKQPKPKPLTAQQIKAIQLLVQGNTTVQVADALKVRRETLWRWRETPLFKTEYEQALADYFADEKRTLLQLRMKAWKTLNQALEMGSVKAAQYVIDQTQPADDPSKQAGEVDVQFGAPLDDGSEPVDFSEEAPA